MDGEQVELGVDKKQVKILGKFDEKKREKEPSSKPSTHST